MKLKLNVIADKPTVNGRIYSRKILEKALSRNKTFSIVLDKPQRPEIKLRDVIATTKSCEINDEGEVFIFIDKIINKTLGEILKLDILLGVCSLGTVKEKFVRDFNIISFYILDEVNS